MNYAEYRKWFDEHYVAISLPSDSTETRPPDVTITSSTLWTLDWLVEFADAHYIRIREHYTKIAGLIDVCQRHSFAFHFGPFTARDAKGIPERKSSDPVVIRIDNAKQPAHLHYGAPEPHHPQSSVRGLDMSTLDLFTFVRAILKHRATGRPLDKILRFTIK